jgi:hypothetical protein
VTYADVLLINSDLDPPRRTAAYPLKARDLDLTAIDCSTWSAWGTTTQNGELICGDSIDFPFDYHVVVVAFPENGYRYMAAARPGRLAGVPCMNEKGVFIGSAGGFAVREIDLEYGIPYTSGIYQHLLRFSDTAAAVFNTLMPWSITRFWNFLISDTQGYACVVEQAGRQKCVRRAGDFGEDEFIYATNNYFCNEMKDAIKGEKFIEHGGWLGQGPSIHSVPRNLEMWEMFNHYKGCVNLEFAKMMWRFPGQPPPYPIDPQAYEATRGKGWDQKICNLDNSRVGIMLPCNGDAGVAYFCAGPAGRVAYPLKPVGGDWYQIRGTHSFYQLALAAGPVEVVEAAKDEAHACIAKAYKELMVLNHRDTGYTRLYDVYTQANTEYYEGINAFNESFLAEGDERLLLLAQAATGFTRAQAHAKQVYHAFVPPPTCPEDMGLKPWKYWEE